jgi:hypothetical protein
MIKGGMIMKTGLSGHAKVWTTNRQIPTLTLCQSKLFLPQKGNQSIQNNMLGRLNQQT